MNNYGHKYSTILLSCFYTAIGVMLKNCFDFDFFDFCKKIPFLKINDIVPAILLFCIIFPQAIWLDKMVEKNNISMKRKNIVYDVIIALSLFIIIISILFF